jgi:hypothetical protein
MVRLLQSIESGKISMSDLFEYDYSFVTNEELEWMVDFLREYPNIETAPDPKLIQYLDICKKIRKICKIQFLNSGTTVEKR